MRSLLRCHIAVAGRALLGVAEAAGSIELLRLVRSEVSDWGRLSGGWKEPGWRGFGREAVLIQTFF